MSKPPRTLRCAIYTRKSSEEGLEQDFNSLHAQREACTAYIASQRHEGWVALSVAFDDGGYSGGTIERPGLQRLLAAVAAGEIDVVVVYKVDRLTRALTDFARIVDAFDAKGVSFVSVTQAFNTTTSMGRLTLNVLLSFAQFEREVTGERIRDKIAASKKKGLWMGGYVPLGYEAEGRTLRINEDEAETVRGIFTRYVELKSVDVLRAELGTKGIATKIRPRIDGRMGGGGSFSRGHLYAMLANPLYIGLIRHKDQIHPGQQPAIIDQTLWQAVQEILAANRRRGRGRASSAHPSLLAGLLVNANGGALTSTHAVKNGQRYRYYVSAPTSNGHGPSAASGEAGGDEKRLRLPAADIERAVLGILNARLRDLIWLNDMVLPPEATIDRRQSAITNAALLTDRLQSPDPHEQRAALVDLLPTVRIGTGAFELTLRRAAIDRHLTQEAEGSPELIVEPVPFVLRRRGVETRLVIEGQSTSPCEPDPALLKALARAHRWWDDLLNRRYDSLRILAAAYDTDERYAARVLRLAFLPAPLVRGILDGTAPPDVTLQSLIA